MRLQCGSHRTTPDNKTYQRIAIRPKGPDRGLGWNELYGLAANYSMDLLDDISFLFINLSESSSVSSLLSQVLQLYKLCFIVLKMINTVVTNPLKNFHFTILGFVIFLFYRYQVSGLNIILTLLRGICSPKLPQNIRH